MTFQILTYIAATAFPLLALMDVYRRRKEFDLTLLVWTLAIVFVPLLGTAFYYLMGRRRIAN